MSREQILQQIAEIDRQINQEIGKTKLPSLNAKYQTFPLKSWISAAVLIGLGLFGRAFIPQPFVQYLWIVAIVGAILALLALYTTLMWLKSKTRRSDSTYKSATGKVEELQAKKAALQQQLKG